MAELTITYQGGMRCAAKRESTGAGLTTSSSGEDLSPTDLVASAVGACMLMTMDTVARRHGIDLAGATAHVHKEMTSVPHRRIGEVGVRIRVPASVAEDQRQRLENAAHACPVHRSLHPDIQMPITFDWGAST